VEGKSPAYVQRQLGHKSITLTVDTYGSWLPSGDQAAIDSLDDVTYTVGTPAQGGGDQVVTLDSNEADFGETAETVPEEFQELVKNGPCWTRTSDPLLKRQLLYLLS
jgi:hypothetical protein